MNRSFFDKQIIKNWNGDCFACGEDTLELNKIATVIRCTSCGLVGKVFEREESAVIEIIPLNAEA